MRQEVKLSVTGFLLGLGSPLGWFLIRLVGGYVDFSISLFSGLVAELTLQKALYLYLTVGTVVSFTAFGYGAGHLMEKVVEKELVIEAKNRDYMRILGFVAHELRSPLTFIKGRLDLILQRIYGVLNDEGEGYLRKALLSCDQINQMISAYLNLARIERGELMLKLDPIDLFSDVIFPVTEEVQNDLEVHKMRVDLKGFSKDKKYFVQGDSQWLKVVFRNLFSNAVRYGYEGTAIELQFKETEQHWMIGVYNQGLGIPLGYTTKVFEKFEKASRDTKVNSVGTGLGLYIVKEIIESHGGKIRCESEPPKWANFILSFPKTQG